MGTGDTVGLRELRQHASEVVRRVEAGRSVMVTVNGRPAAEIVPVQARRWRTWAEVQDVLQGTADPDLLRDLAEWDDAPTDPFTR